VHDHVVGRCPVLRVLGASSLVSQAPGTTAEQLCDTFGAISAIQKSYTHREWRLALRCSVSHGRANPVRFNTLAIEEPVASVLSTYSESYGVSGRVGTAIAVSVQEHRVVAVLAERAKLRAVSLRCSCQEPGRCGLVLVMLYQAHSGSMKWQEQQPRGLDPFTTDRESRKRPGDQTRHSRM